MSKGKIHVFRNEKQPQIPPKPPFESISGKALLHMAKPWWQHWLSYTGAAVVAGGTLVVSLLPGPKKGEPTKKVLQRPISAIQVPVKAWEIPFDTFVVDVEHGDTVVYKNCTKIIVPPGGITQYNGAAIHGYATILYREFRNQSDIMASGIPMLYDSAGQKWLLESNGIFEIRSAVNHKIKKENGLYVEMCTQKKENRFNWYTLNEKTGAWSYLEPTGYISQPVGESEPFGIKTQRGQTITVQNKTALADTAAKMRSGSHPVAPRMKDPRAYVFNVDAAHIPELAVYQNVLFEVLPGQDYNPNTLPDEYDYIKIKTTPNDGIYLVILRVDNQIYRYYARPVFNNIADYNKALEVYRQELAKDIIKENKTVTLIDNATVQKPVYTGTPVSQFRPAHFGIFNSARPIDNANQKIKVSYAVKGHPGFNGKLYQYFENRNAVMQYDGPTQATIRYNEKDRCVLVAIVNDQIALLTSEDFNKTVKSQQTEITLEPLDRRFNNAEEINQYIYKELRSKQ